MNPSDLPNVMVIVQELESNNMRALFANSFPTSQRATLMSQTGGNGEAHLNHKSIQQNNNYDNQRNNNNSRFSN